MHLRQLLLVPLVLLGYGWAAAADKPIEVPPLRLSETEATDTGTVASGASSTVDAEHVQPAIPLRHSEVKADAKAKGEGEETLSSLVAEALRHNGDVQASQEDVHINEGVSHYERRNYFPRLVGDVHYKTEPDKDNHGQTERYYRYGYGIHADQMLWDFGETRGKVHQAHHKAEAAGHATELEKVDVAYDVVEAYWRAVMYRGIVAHREKSLAALKRNAKAIADRMEAKAAFAADHKDALASVAKAEETLVRAQNGLAVAKRRLLYLVGRDVDGDIQLAGTLDFEEPTKPGPVSVEKHPDMKRVRALQDSADSARSSARGMLFPRLYFRGYWDFQRPEENRGEVITQYGPKGYYYMASINVKIPIGMEWVAGRGKMKEAEAKQRQLRQQARALTEAIKYRVSDAKFRLQEEVQGLRASEKRCEAARSALELRQDQQKAKKATQSAVAQAEDELAQAEIGRLQALYDVRCAEALLLREMGEIAGR
jgi:outer membrane protein